MDRSPPKPAPLALLRWALSPRPGELALLAITLLGVWACELGIPFLLGKTVDTAIERHAGFHGLAELGAATLALTLMLYLLHAVYLRREARTIARAACDLRQHLYTRIMSQPLSFFADNATGEIAHQIMADADVIDNHGIYLFADVPFAVLSVTGIFIVMAIMQIKLALLVLATLSGAVVLARITGHPLGAMERTVRHRWSLMGGLLQETFGAIRTVKIFGRESHERNRLDSANAELSDAENASGRIFARLEPLLELIRTSGVLLVVWYGAYLVYAGAITAGVLVAFIAYMERMNEAIQDAGSYYRHYEQTKGTLGHIVELLGKLVPAPRTGSLRQEGVIALGIHDVCLRYSGRSDAVLRNVSFSVEPGEIVAIMGVNGSGKTTLMDIILGLRAPDSGSVFIGGLTIEDWDEDFLRKAISAIPQDVVLFSGTLEDNIRYGALTASGEDIARAAKEAGLSDVVARLPQGFASAVGERGAMLSGGERQRVALARALLSDARILVLDEPDAMLDCETSLDLMRVLRKSAHSRVTLIVTHNPRTAQDADRTLILRGGKLENFDARNAGEADNYLTVAATGGKMQHLGHCGVL